MNALPQAPGSAAAVSAFSSEGENCCPESSEPPFLNAELELRDLALDSIRQGLCVFDRYQRLRLFNRQYAEMYGLDPGQLRLGMTLCDVIDVWL